MDTNKREEIESLKGLSDRDLQRLYEAASANAEPGRGRGWRIVAIVVAALLVVALVAAFGLRSCEGEGSFFDANAQSGQAPYKTPEEIQAELDRIVQEGMFNISIASELVFADGSSEAIAYIENVPGNRYHMQVTITLDDTGEEVYVSGAIAPDNYIETIALERDLAAGTYPATATFRAIDKESLDEVGKAAAKVTLVVEG